jgi:hypothetical protein
MPFRVEEPPPGVLEELRNTLNAFARRERFRTPALSRARADRLTLTAPHPVYVLGLQDIVEGRGLGEARLVGWRYLIELDRRPIASADVLAGLGGRPPKFSQFNEGPFVDSTAAAIDALQEQSEVREAPFQLRSLQVPALYVVSLWLAGQGGQRDLVRPLAPAPAYLNVERLYSEEEFLEQLREPARNQLAFDSSPRPEGPTST